MSFVHLSCLTLPNARFPEAAAADRSHDDRGADQLRPHDPRGLRGHGPRCVLGEFCTPPHPTAPQGDGSPGRVLMMMIMMGVGVSAGGPGAGADEV